MAEAPQYILMVESAMGGASAGVCCVRTGDVFARTLEDGQGQAEMLVLMVQGAVADAGIVMMDLGLIVSTIGPGSFTGLRTGMSCARSLALALDLPLVGVNSFEVLAAAYGRDHDEVAADTVCVLVESRRAEFYAQFFDSALVACSEPLVIAQEDLAARMAGRRTIVIGDAVFRFVAGDGALVVDGYGAPDLGVMARMGLERFVAGELKAVEPLYLRDADVSLSKKPQRILQV